MSSMLEREVSVSIVQCAIKKPKVDCLSYSNTQMINSIASADKLILLT